MMGFIKDRGKAAKYGPPAWIEEARQVEGRRRELAKERLEHTWVQYQRGLLTLGEYVTAVERIAHTVEAEVTLDA